MKTKKNLYGFLSVAIMMMFSSCMSGKSLSSEEGSTESDKSTVISQSQTSGSDLMKPEMELIGHSSVKIKLTDGRIIYIDPAYTQQENAYDDPADIILVTHDHSDHNQINLITKNEKCVTITQNEAINDGVYQKFDIYGLTVEAVPAENANHDINNCVGYVLSFDGITLYDAGDTSTVQETIDLLALRRIDYALYPIDGMYNMDANEATKFAKSIGAKNNIPMHINSISSSYDEEKAKTFTPGGALYVPYGETIKLRRYTSK